MVKLSKNQQDIIYKEKDSNLLVLSLPGGGKTRTLLERVNFLINSQNVSKDRILIITFTNAAVNDIQNKIELEHIYTIDSLCARLCFKHEFFDKDILYLIEPDDYKYEVYKNLNKIEKDWDYIFVDEVQDIDYIQYKIIKHYNDLDCRLYLTGDINQNIYSFRGTSNKYILEYDKYFHGLQKFLLNINYRSSKNIISLLNEIELKMNTDMSLYSNLYNNENHCLFKKVDSMKDYVFQIKTIIDQNKLPIKKCCIMSRNNEYINMIYNDFFQIKKYRKMNYTTIHSSKGLEYEYLFLIGLNDGILPNLKCSDINEELRLYYVAISRAKYSLFVLYDKKPSRFLWYHSEFVSNEKKKINYKNITVKNIFGEKHFIDQMEKYYSFRKRDLLSYNIQQKSIKDIIPCSFIEKNDLFLEYHIFLYLIYSRFRLCSKELEELQEFQFKFPLIKNCLEKYLNKSIPLENILDNIFIIACVYAYKKNKKRLKGYLLFENNKIITKKNVSEIKNVMEQIKSQKNVKIVYQTQSQKQKLVDILIEKKYQCILDIITNKLIFIHQ